MWIVRLALRRPYTFVVLSLLLLILGPIVILRTPTDIFPNINIPVVSIVWNYAGLSPQEMANRIVTPFERNMTTTVNDIEHIESQSLNGIAVIKVFFQPNANVPAGVAEVTAIAQTALRQLPPGTTPPLIITYSASSVPVLQLSLSGQGISEQQFNDIGTNFIRTQLATVQGASIPFPYGGKQRQVQVDIDSQALQAKGLSPSDVVNAFNAQNIVLPAGTAKVGSYEYQVETNSSPQTIQELNDLPIRTINGATIYVHDVSHVRDGFPPQTNIVRVDGQRSSLVTIQKSGSVSTLDIIRRVRDRLPQISAALPPQLRIQPLADQSVFVRGAINGVVREALIAACLTAIMILVFLGSWRSTIIIAVSIPLSILVSIITMSALGETINIMTLGGLALAVGILVDDATVEIENINRNIELGKETEQAILDGAAQIAIPAFVSTLSICIVFVPMFFLSGVARYLFVPLAEAVVFAMLASYFLSRTIVPTMAKYLLKPHSEAAEEAKKTSRNPFIVFQRVFERNFERLRSAYHSFLAICVESRAIFLLCFFGFCLVSMGVLYPWLGQDFFPTVDSGQFKLHVRAPMGTRIEETAKLCDEIDQTVRELIPKSELVTIIDNIGLPYSGLNLSYSNSAPVGTGDADILVTLNEDHHPTAPYMQELRRRLLTKFPGTTFYYLPTDIVSQILNFGLPAPLDVQVVGSDIQADRDYAQKLLAQIRQVAGTTDLRIQQPFDAPKFTVAVDRTQAQQVGYTQRDVAGNLLVTLSGSFQTAPSYWLNPQNGVTYNIAIQEPQYDLQNLQDLRNIPVTGTNGAPPQILGNLASITRGTEPGTVSHYNVQPVIDIYGSVENTDLASVAKEIDKIIANNKKSLPRGAQVIVRGQIQTMRESFIGLVGGLFFSIVLVYLLIVVNFQSWLDPFIIIAALPAALCGIVWFLFLTHTRISVPALTGSIMCMGVATANSILVVSFAQEQMAEGMTAVEAALSAGFTRFRPVLMTALAMIIGMVPMALGLGDGGEQNAPLGRAVIGGLLLATIATLTFVPVFFSLLHRNDKLPQQLADDSDM
ncbi:efflux RND transporter permease subunit [Granulicella arctica]|uniref:CzcA family heavy metal efflux pump n=1 Tax=Granulicella arctica TaxID=940613 RepID=A0A7Y9PIE7_9BACT|nr:efflux RND transporter permease subunit [Granulicella arctica]NYF80467.1 CzcA family heavy metal efflux pump [Granulicella arctica]